MDLKHTTKAELAEENAALKKQLAAVERERDAFQRLAADQSKELDEWARLCNSLREQMEDFRFESAAASAHVAWCHKHPLKNFWSQIKTRLLRWWMGGDADAADRSEKA